MHHRKKIFLIILILFSFGYTQAKKNCWDQIVNFITCEEFEEETQPSREMDLSGDDDDSMDNFFTSENTEFEDDSFIAESEEETQIEKTEPNHFRGNDGDWLFEGTEDSQKIRQRRNNRTRANNWPYNNWGEAFSRYNPSRENNYRCFNLFYSLTGNKEKRRNLDNYWSRINNRRRNPRKVPCRKQNGNDCGFHFVIDAIEELLNIELNQRQVNSILHSCKKIERGDNGLESKNIKKMLMHHLSTTELEYIGFLDSVDAAKRLLTDPTFILDDMIKLTKHFLAGKKVVIALQNRDSMETSNAYQRSIMGHWITLIAHRTGRSTLDIKIKNHQDPNAAYSVDLVTKRGVEAVHDYLMHQLQTSLMLERRKSPLRTINPNLRQYRF